MKKILYVVAPFLVIGLIIVSLFLYNKNNYINIEDSLVYVVASSNDMTSFGSGFVYKINKNKNKAYIITSYHVVEDYNNIYVYNKNNVKVKGKILNYDINNDVVLNEISNDLSLKSLKLGNSDNIKVKDNIYVVGSPIENEYFATVTSGIISYNNRKIKVETSNGSVLVNTIQIDAKINYGNSGSPLLNEKNEVIGMVFVKEEELDGIGFAIPINKIKEVIK